MAYISNHLTHWVGSKLSNDDDKYDILVNKIIKNKQLLYSDNDISFNSKYGGIKRRTWKIPMVCFTDIPFSEVENLCERYSKFGISFLKADLANACVSPVWYTLSPFVYEAYSYIYHSINGLRSVINGQTIPEGKRKGEVFYVHDYLQKLHNIIAFFQDCAEQEFEHVEGTLNANDKQEQILNDLNNFYFEREWRTVYRKGDSYPWNEDQNGEHYFRFLEESIKYVIVPKEYLGKLKKDIMNNLKPENMPNLIAYEELKYM